MNDPGPEMNRTGIVSLWVGQFPSVEAAEIYFGVPDEIGVYLPPEAFAADFGLPEFPPDSLEVNFEQTAPRPLAELLRDATFSPSYAERAVAEASAQGVHEAQGIALLFNFDYNCSLENVKSAVPLRFIGAFTYFRISPDVDLQPYRDLARTLGCPVASVLFVAGALREASGKRRKESGTNAGHVSAGELCGHLLTCRGEHSRATLRELGLPRSEEVGQIVFGLADAGLIRRQESDRQSDFEGLFTLDRPHPRG